MPVLVFRATVRAPAANVPVRQEHVVAFAEHLLDPSLSNVACLAECLIDISRQNAILFGVGRVVVIKLDLEAGKVAAVFVPYPCDQSLPRHSLLPRPYPHPFATISLPTHATHTPPS